MDANNLYGNLFLLRKKVRELLVAFLAPFPVRIYLLALAVLNIILWYYAKSISALAAGSPIALHYNVDFGINLIGEGHRIFMIPLLGLFTAGINSMLSFIFHHGPDAGFIVNLLLAAAVLTQVFLLAALLTIYFINS